MSYMQRLIPDVPITGETPDTDPEFGWMYDVIEQVGSYRKELEHEIGFDGITTEANGDVHLTYKGKRVARVQLDGHHADSRLQVLDPR